MMPIPPRYADALGGRQNLPFVGNSAEAAGLGEGYQDPRPSFLSGEKGPQTLFGVGDERIDLPFVDLFLDDLKEPIQVFPSLGGGMVFAAESPSAGHPPSVPSKHKTTVPGTAKRSNEG